MAIYHNSLLCIGEKMKMYKHKTVTKKADMKRKPGSDEGHWEGSYWCNCRMRNIRNWLSKKKYGFKEEDGNEDRTL